MSTNMAVNTNFIHNWTRLGTNPRLLPMKVMKMCTVMYRILRTSVVLLPSPSHIRLQMFNP